jgi:formylglycine-generating enzyme required for sulfatase activity
VLDELLDPSVLTDLQAREHRLLAGFLALSMVHNEATREELFERVARHQDPGVRSMVLSVAHLHYPSPATTRYICAATHDTDDVVFVRAFRVAGVLRLEQALLDLKHFVTPASLLRKNIVENKDGLTVGLAAANALAACCAIFGTGDPEELAQREEAYAIRSFSPLFARQIEFKRELERTKPPSYPQTELSREPGLDDMVLIPGGPFLFGVDQQQVPFGRFDSQSYTPLQLAFTGAFYIDKYPVTNAQYDEFVRIVESSEERTSWEHPDQSPGKSHRRNTWDDPRFAPDHPVTGINWYDAYAYARWQGKTLPTEQEWEKACRGLDGRIFPWGDKWDPANLHSADAVFGRSFEKVIDWRAELVRFGREYPAVTTGSVCEHELEGASPYGVVDMLGNAWEYTCTCFATGDDLQPRFKGLPPKDFMNTPEAQVVIKGGAWSSIPELTSAAYRGQDLLTDRHCEIGFRCVHRV